MIEPHMAILAVQHPDFKFHFHHNSMHDLFVLQVYTWISNTKVSKDYC